MKAIVIDIDGTLTDERRRLDCTAAAAIRELLVPVILATGNVLCYARCAAKLIGTSGIMIAENGGVVSMGFDGPVFINGDKSRCENALGILNRQLVLEELDRTLRRSEVALRRNFDIQAAREILQNEGILDIELVDTGFAVHLKNVEVNKGTGLLRVSQLMEMELADFMAVGDSPNDMEMLKVAGLGVAVANAHPDLKNIADLVTAGTYGKGVTEALEYMSRNKKE